MVQVVIDAFRLIDSESVMLGHESRQTTSNTGHLHKPSIQGLIHGVNRHYYSIAVNFRKNAGEERMLTKLQNRSWTTGLKLQNFADFRSHNTEQAQVPLLCFCFDCLCADPG